MPKIDITHSRKYALEGRVVTMDQNLGVMDSGVVYVEGDKIVDVKKSVDPPPTGFEQVTVLKTGGTIYPGLIELHNHLSYNIVPMWMVPEKFEEREQWRNHPDYKSKMTGPLKVLGGIDGYLQAIVRYVECKLLFSGVTSSQGITLASHSGIERWYRGIVRNVEQATDKELPAAEPRVADAEDAMEFLKLLEKEKTCYLHHLAEGIPKVARKHFKVLHIPPDKWAITENYAGIHAVGLKPADFKVMRDFKGSMVWSPMSNLMLYGVTANVASAQKNKLLIGLGSDWSASGSKNLLCELKVARLHGKELGKHKASGTVFTDEELVRMVTTNAARILKWDKVGSLKTGMKADLIVVDGKGKKNDQYKKLVEAKEADITFVVIGGWPRMGSKKLMGAFDVPQEEVKIGSKKRRLYLKNELPNVVDIGLSYAEACQKLKDGMKTLPDLAEEAVRTGRGIFAGAPRASGPDTTWYILPDHEDLPAPGQPRLSPAGDPTAGRISLADAAQALSESREPMALDPPTVMDDRNYFKNIALQKNVPKYIKRGLPVYYGR